MRSFCGLYFLLRIVVFTSSWSQKIASLDLWFTRGVIFFITALIISSFKPYRKAYMNHMDTLLLLNLALLCYVMSSDPNHSNLTVLTLPRILLSISMAVFILTPLLNNVKFISLKLRAIRALFATDREPAQSSTADAPATAQEQQPLIQPTSTEINYGIYDKAITED